MRVTVSVAFWPRTATAGDSVSRGGCVDRGDTAANAHRSAPQGQRASESFVARRASWVDSAAEPPRRRRPDRSIVARRRLGDRPEIARISGRTLSSIEAGRRGTRSEVVASVNGSARFPRVPVEVGGLDLEPVVAVREESRAPGVGEVEAVEAGLARTVLSGAGAYTQRNLSCGRRPCEKSIGVCQGRTVRPPRRTRQRIRDGVTGRSFHGAGTGSGGIWCASAITSTAPVIPSGRSARPLRESTIFVTRASSGRAHGESAPGRSGSRYESPRRSVKWTWSHGAST